MDRRLVGNKVKVRHTSPDEFRVRVHTIESATEKVCPACGGWGTIPNGMDGNPEMCQTCEGSGVV